MDKETEDLRILYIMDQAQEAYFVCPHDDCDNTLVRDELKDHMNTFHPNFKTTKSGRKKCPFCSYEFADWGQHREKCASFPGFRYKCKASFCSAEYKDKMHLEAHQKLRHNYVKCEWDDCCEYYDNDELLNHVKIFHNGKAKFVKCLKCEESVAKSFVYRHLRTCDKYVMSREEKLRMGYIGCTELGCDLSFYGMEELENHLLKTHKMLVLCPVASCYSSIRKNVILAHVARMHKHRKDICRYCGETIKIFYLKKHLETCSRKGQYPCGRPKCMQRFTRLADRASHILDLHKDENTTELEIKPGAIFNNRTSNFQSGRAASTVIKLDGPGAIFLKNASNSQEKCAASTEMDFDNDIEVIDISDDLLDI